MFNWEDPRLVRLERAKRPAWVWDAARRLIVWATDAAAELWGLEDAFLLVDQPFGERDPVAEDLSLAASALNHAEGIDAQVRLWQGDSQRSIAVEARRFARTETGDLVLFTLARGARERTAASTTANPIAELLGPFPIGLAIFTTTGRCIYGNHAFARLLGATQGLSFTDLTGSPRAGERLARQLLGAGSARIIPTISRGGAEMTLQVDAALIADAASHQTAFFVQAQDVSARRGLERQLGARFELMKSILEANVDGWIVLDQRLRLRTLGGFLFDDADKAQSAIGLPWREAFERLGIDVDEALTRTFGSRDSTQVPLPSDPSRSLAATPRWSEEGDFLGYQITLSASASATREPEGLARIIDLGTTALIGHNNFEITYANERATQLFGAPSPQSLIKRPFLDLFAEDEKRASEHYDALGGDNSEVLTPALHAERLDGSAIIVDAEFRKANLFGEDLVLASFHDVTRLAGLSEQAANSNAWLDILPIAIVVIDNRGLITQANAQAVSLMKLSTDELEGRAFDDFIDRDDRAAYSIRRAAANSMAPGLVATLETHLKPRPDLSIATQLALRPTALSDGLVIAISSLEAREERQAALKQSLEHSQELLREKTDFLSAISHEMRTPLNAIIGFSEFMLEGRLGPIGNEKYAGYVDDIHMSGQHLLSLVNDLLDMSKIEAGRYELDFAPVAIEDVVEQALRIIRPSADKKGVLLVKQLGGAPPVMADLRALRQILLNLLSNAVKFTPSPGSVTVKTSSDTLEGVKIEVVDTGLGMAPAELARALEPYAQVHSAHANDERGTGLGLPLAKALTEANHARFTIESEAGKGTRITIIFPAAQVAGGVLGSI